MADAMRIRTPSEGSMICLANNGIKKLVWYFAAKKDWWERERGSIIEVHG